MTFFDPSHTEWPFWGAGARRYQSKSDPGRAGPSCVGPGRAEPGGVKPGPGGARPAGPHPAVPSQAEPSRTGPSRAERSRAEPSRAEPGRAEPSRAGPGRAGPSRASPGPQTQFCGARCFVRNAIHILGPFTMNNNKHNKNNLEHLGNTHGNIRKFFATHTI